MYSEQVGGSCKLIFYRPFKQASSEAKIIIGTVNPDEILLKLANGCWASQPYKNVGRRQFVAGVFDINIQPLEINIVPGEKIFIKAELLAEKFKLMAQLQVVEKGQAKRDIMKLVKQNVKNPHKI